MNRRVGNRARVINELHALDATLRDALARLVEEAQPDVPLAHQGRRVAPCAQHLRQRELVLLDEARPADAREHAAVVDAKRHLPGEQTVAGGRADRGRRMRVGEPHPLARQPVEMRRGHFRLRVVAADVAVAEVVREDDEDVRIARVGGEGGGQQDSRQRQNSEPLLHEAERMVHGCSSRTPVFSPWSCVTSASVNARLKTARSSRWPT